MSGSGKGVQNLMRLWYWEIKIKHFYGYEYQQLSLSVLLFILPLKQFVIISFFLTNARAYCTFYIYLAKPLSKVHVSNNRPNTDYDPQDVPLQSRMVNKIG